MKHGTFYGTLMGFHQQYVDYSILFNGILTETHVGFINKKYRECSQHSENGENEWGVT
jgi:hypothetical protein